LLSLALAPPPARSASSGQTERRNPWREKSEVAIIALSADIGVEGGAKIQTTSKDCKKLGHLYLLYLLYIAFSFRNDTICTKFIQTSTKIDFELICIENSI
jgi:hypothetical protein